LRRLGFEGLELRRLLAEGIREIPVPTPNSNPFWITSGPGSALYFTAGGTNQIVEYKPATQSFLSFLIPGISLGSQSTIAAGSDGNLYFTSSSVNVIGQFNPAVGLTQSFQVPTSNLGTSYITTGPDGNLYFTASTANVIERLDPTTHGFFTFPIPTTKAGAAGITSGPSGSLWFVETTANKIGQLNPTTRVITEFPIPLANSGATYITTGLDGNLYFTAPAVNDLVQFNPTSRRFTTYPIPTANSGAATITAGSDGNIYFTEPSSNQIGQFNPSTRVFATFPIPTANSGVAGIAAGPDGNVYFTESAANKLGELVLTTGTATTTQLTATPNPAVVGQVVTLTATVRATTRSPTGTVTFFIDGTAQPAVKVVVRNGVAQATLSTKLGAATYLVTAVYKAHAGSAGSVSNAVSLIVAPAPGDGPTVVNLVRLGFHAEPTTLVLSFDKPLDLFRAQDLGNYKIVQVHGRPVPIGLVGYDPTDHTVTIFPRQRLNLHRSYRLTVVGTAPGGLTDTSGNLLDGALTGHPGSDYVATVTSRNLRLPG
jgi:virginiamycin B lyase